MIILYFYILLSWSHIRYVVVSFKSEKGMIFTEIFNLRDGAFLFCCDMHYARLFCLSLRTVSKAVYEVFSPLFHNSEFKVVPCATPISQTS